MQQVKFDIVGTTPLVMHKDTLCDPLDPITKQMKSISSKRKKTDEDHKDMAKIDWRAGLYYDQEVGPYIPGAAIVACIRDAARMQKKGKDLIRAITLMEIKSKLKYEGPNKPEDLFGDGNTEFVDKRSVRVGQAKVMRYRPVFRNWSITFTVLFNELLFNREEIVELVENAGSMIGLLEMRPMFGKFQVANAA